MENEAPHSPNITSLHLRHSSFSKPSAALPTSQLIVQLFSCFIYVIGISPTSQLILQPFCRFTYVTAHFTALPFLHLRHRHFTYVTAHSPTLPSLYLSHSSFSNPSVASPTSQFILQTFFRLFYVTSSSLNSPGEPPMICSTCVNAFR